MARHNSRGNSELAPDLMHRFSTAVVLLHRAVAEHLGLGPTDHKVLDILRQRGEMTGSELAAITGLTTGAMTGVVDRLEAAGFLLRRSDQKDGRRQLLNVTAKISEIRLIFEPIHQAFGQITAEFGEPEKRAIEKYLREGTEVIYRHIGLLRAPPSPAEQLGREVEVAQQVGGKRRGKRAN